MKTIKESIGATGTHQKEITRFWETKKGYVPVWQTLAWNAFLQKTGYATGGFFCGVFEWETLVAYAILEERTVGFGQKGLFCVGGPNAIDPKALPLLSQVIEEIAAKRKPLFVQLEPIDILHKMPGFSEGEWKHFLEPATLVVDLDAPDEKILAQMKQKGRYNIRLAEKHGVMIEHADRDDPEGLADFMRLLQETLSRDGFSGNSTEYYRALLASRSGKSEGLYLAKKDGETIAAAILVIEGTTAVYYYGASTSDNEKRKFMPAYLLQWEMMRAAKASGCQVYDFLGIAPEGTQNHRLAGVSDFKRKFGGREAVFPEKWIRVKQPAAFLVLSALRKIRSMF